MAPLIIACFLDRYSLAF